MESAAVPPAPVLQHPHPAPFGAVFGGDLLEPDDSMGDRMHGLVGQIRREVVEKQHGRALLREIVLEAEDLASISQRALREQPDLGQAVEDDAMRLPALDGLEDALGRLAELE